MSITCSAATSSTIDTYVNSWSTINNMYTTMKNNNKGSGSITVENMNKYNSLLGEYNIYGLTKVTIGTTSVWKFKDGTYTCNDFCTVNNTAQIVPKPSPNSSSNNSSWMSIGGTCYCPSGYFPDMDPTTKILVCRETSSNSQLRADITKLQNINSNPGTLSLTLK